jgi:hypothetical protein
MPPLAHPATAILRISPKPPRAYRAGIAFDASFADERAVVIARASLRERLFNRTSGRARYASNIDAQRRDTRCDVIAARLRERRQGSPGRFGCRTFVPR